LADQTSAYSIVIYPKYPAILKISNPTICPALSPSSALEITTAKPPIYSLFAFVVNKHITIFCVICQMLNGFSFK